MDTYESIRHIFLPCIFYKRGKILTAFFKNILEFFNVLRWINNVIYKEKNGKSLQTLKVFPIELWTCYLKKWFFVTLSFHISLNNSPSIYADFCELY